MIHNIEIDRLHPHPDNPRKDLGDLVELASSIKANGILQNLTVTPWNFVETDPDKLDEDYDRFVVINGHRRLAAAKLAGLAEVPCAIVEMKHRQQIATMLLENIQRSDLTPIEQAQGFQMMMDLGDTVSGIAEKTGFSYSTIRHRLNLMQLDQKKLQESYQRGGTLMDFVELEKLKDEKLKNEVLEYIGTPNFKWMLDAAIDREAQPERRKKLLEFLKDWAQQIKKAPANPYNYEQCFYKYKIGDFKKPKDANEGGYTYFDSGTDIKLYKKEAKEKKKKANPAEKTYKEQEAQMKDIICRAYESRFDFVKNFAAGKTYKNVIQDFVMKKLLHYGRAEIDDLLELLGIEIPVMSDDVTIPYMTRRDECDNKKTSLVLEKYNQQPERIMFLAAYLGRDDHKTEGYCSFYSYKFSLGHFENEKLDDIYDALISMGYEMSDEEQQLRDGTHPLFTALTIKTDEEADPDAEVN